MKEAWQYDIHHAIPSRSELTSNSVYNIKRRIASLPPLSQDVFEKQIQEAIEKDAESSSSSDEESSGDERSLRVSPLQCLFCNQNFASEDKSHDSEDESADEDEPNEATIIAFTTNLKHMRQTHNLQIPNLDKLTDPRSFIEYLATEIRIWHECLYCGATKPSTAAIQAHMRDKSHCMLNFDREPELLEFWEEGVSTRKLPDEGAEGGRRLDEGEMRTGTGKILGSKELAQVARKEAIKEAKKKTAAARLEAPEPTAESTSDAEPAPSSTAQAGPSTTLTIRDNSQHTPPPPLSSAAQRQLARRELMGITGLTEQQRHALMVTEKKAQRSEAVAQRARDWIRNRGANSQKNDQILTTGFKGRQNHKLMPR
jgi:pre-60S factor REI1